MTLANAGSRVSGFSGCNRFTGSFKQTGSELGFSQMAGTMMACLAREMELESEVLKALGATTHYRIEGEHLLLLTRDKVVARFESVYLR
jgi:heat shock protein HslJ